MPSPFAIFAPYKEIFDVRLLTKDAALQTDDDLRTALASENSASLKQVHGSRAIVVKSAMRRAEEADAMATDTPDLWLSIRAADCQQFVTYAPEQHVAAVIHAGWKGLKAGIIPACFSMLKQQWNIAPNETLVGIGPSLCMNCAEFTDPQTELAGLNSHFFDGRRADLRGIADDQLRRIGVPISHCERNNDCTKCSNDIYWSYRGGDSERVRMGCTNVIVCRIQSR